MTKVFGMSSKDLVREVYFLFLSEVSKAVRSEVVSFDAKLGLIMGFRFREISRSTELSKKLGIYNIEEFFQNLFYDKGGVELMNRLLLEVIRKGDFGELSKMEREFVNEVGEFYNLFEPNIDVDIEIGLMSLLEEAQKITKHPEFEHVLFKIS
jgi:hypothetical protein